MSMLTGTNLVYTKQYNLRIVHEVIRVFGPLSRAEIARHTELTVQTVSNLTKELIASGLVYEAERRQEGRGAPSTTLALNPGGAHAIGLDLDRDHLTGVLVDLSGTARQRVHVELDFPTPAQALELLVETANALMERQQLRPAEVSGVGIGVPGPMHLSENGKDYVVNPRAFPGWHDIPLASWVRERLSMPVFLENNATAAAVGERWYGGGQQIKTFFYFYFGSGLGGGLVMNGQPYEGFTGNAGELGYMPLAASREARWGDDKPHVGLHFNLPRLYEKLRADGACARTPEDLERLLCEGNPRLLEWMDIAARHLSGLALAIEYLIDPEAIFFGGRLPDRILEGLMGRLGERLPKRRLGEKPPTPAYLLATAGADAAALGVATLPIYESFAPAPHVLLKQGRNQAPALNASWAVAGG